MREPTILRHLSVLYRISQIRINRKLKPYGIGAGQYPFMLALLRHPGISQDALSRHLVIDKGTTAKAVKTLRKAGFVVRERDGGDKRAFKLFATEKGEALREILDGILLEWRDALWSGFDQKERDAAYSLAERMAANAQAAVD